MAKTKKIETYENAPREMLGKDSIMKEKKEVKKLDDEKKTETEKETKKLESLKIAKRTRRLLPISRVKLKRGK